MTKNILSDISSIISLCLLYLLPIILDPQKVFVFNSKLLLYMSEKWKYCIRAY